jgi:adenylate cyclase
VYVGFADIVGFTRLGERVELGELGALGARLTELALAHTKPPTRLVKTIGDAVMFVSPSADSLLDTMLDLVERGEQDDDEFPQLRAGVAAGLAVSREGDWYGPPVNLASRVTGVARPGSVLATEEVHDAAGDGYAWSDAGARELKGLKRRVPLYRVRPAQSRY